MVGQSPPYEYLGTVCNSADKPLSLWDWDSSRSERGVEVREENN